MVTPQWGQFQQPSVQNDLIDEDIRNNIQETPGQVEDELKPEGEKPQWGNFQNPSTFQGNIDPNSEESLVGWVARNAVSNMSRLGEQIGGRYGNIEKFGRQTLKNIPALSGLIGWGLQELVGQENWEKILTPEGSAPNIPIPGQIENKKQRESFLPSSEQLKQLSQEISGGYTKPRTKGEEGFQEFIEDVGSLISPRTGIRGPNVAAGTRRPNIQLINRHLLIPAAANATKQTLKWIGFGEDTANMAKMSVWLPLSLANEVNGNQYAADLMNRGRNMFPQGLRGNVARLTNSLDQLERSPQFVQGPRTRLAIQQINRIRQDLANGQDSAQSLLNMYDEINAVKRSNDMFQLGGDRTYATQRVNDVLDVVRQEIEALGANHPEALQNWQNGLNAWAAIHQSNRIQNWLQEVARGPYAKMLAGPALALFGVGGYGLTNLPAAISVPGAAAATATYNTGKVLMRMLTEPNLRNYYWNAVNGAIRENANSFINNFNKLNKGLKKQSKKQSMV